MKRPKPKSPTPVAPLKRPKSAPIRSKTTQTNSVQTGGVGVDLETLSDSGKAPRTRLRDSKAAHNLFIKLLTADEKSAYNRTILREMVDGAPPQSDAALAQNGMGWVYNLNFLEADSHLAAALVSYDDLIDSTENLIVPHLKYGVVGDEDLADVLDVIAEEFTTMIRENSEFYTNWNRLASEFVGHGVGFAYFPDEETPWWEPAGWDEALIPRKTKATEEAISIFITRHEYRVNDLYRFIDEQEYAAKWNPDEVKKAIVGAAKGRKALNEWRRFWPQVEKELKNNDLGFGIGDAEVVQAVHYWVKEFDGSYTFAIGLADGTNADYLYRDEKRYDEATRAFVSFTLGVGNGTFHSIRGALWKMFPFVQTSNRFRNKMLTNTDVAMTLLLQGGEGDSYDDMTLTIGPAVGYVPAGAKVLERALPDVGTQGLPIVRELGASLRSATGQFQAPAATSQPTDGKGNPPSKYQIQSEQAAMGSLTSNSVNRFYRKVDLLFGEQFRRCQAIGKSGKDMGKGRCRYKTVRDFFERCAERGVPEQVIKAVRTVTAQRSIGNGSPQMRILALDELQQMQGSLDETGRALATRDRIAARFGRVAADRYKPRVKRLAPDTTIAVIENAALKADSIPVLPDQNHTVHASIHVPKFQDVISQIVSFRDQDPEADFAPMQPLLEFAFRLHEHSSQHVQAMVADELRVQDMKSYRAALEQGGNLLAGFARELQQQQRHAQSQAQDHAEAANDPKFEMEIQRQQEELQQKRELHAKNLELASAKIAQVAQDMRLKAIETDAKVAEGIKNRQNRAPDTLAA